MVRNTRGMGIANREVLRPASRVEWRAWLAEHHADSPGVWVEYPKVRSGLPGPTYDDLVEEALCFGWIDSVVRKTGVEGIKCMQVSPRQPGSIWAKTNKVRLQRLEHDGMLTPAGTAVIARAKSDGSWMLLDDVEAEVIADDLARAFRAVHGSSAAFQALPASRRQQLLYWVYSAKRPATRAQRITAVVHGTAP